MQPKEGVARRRNRCRQTRETAHRPHHARLDAPAPGVLHALHHKAIATHAEAREREGGTRRVAAQSLACEIIVGGDMDAGVQADALVHDGVGDARGRLGKLVLGALAGVRGRLESRGSPAASPGGSWPRPRCPTAPRSRRPPRGRGGARATSSRARSRTAPSHAAPRAKARAPPRSALCRPWLLSRRRRHRDRASACRASRGAPRAPVRRGVE